MRMCSLTAAALTACLSLLTARRILTTPPNPHGTLCAPQWWCSHKEEGSLREQPLYPNLATEDCFSKVTLFMEWISRNAPGWSHWKKNAEAMVRGRRAAWWCQLCQATPAARVLPEPRAA